MEMTSKTYRRPNISLCVCVCVCVCVWIVKPKRSKQIDPESVLEQFAANTAKAKELEELLQVCERE